MEGSTGAGDAFNFESTFASEDGAFGVAIHD